MQQVEVRIIRSHPTQRIFTAGEDVPPPRVEGIYLADQKETFPRPPDCFAHQCFGSAFAVHFGSVDQIHPLGDSCTQGAAFLPEGGRVLPQIPRSLPDGAYCGAAFRNKYAHPRSFFPVTFSSIVMAAAASGKKYPFP